MRNVGEQSQLWFTLFGISLLGTRMRLYTWDQTNSQISPPVVPFPSLDIPDIPDSYLKGEWAMDLLMPDGCAAFLQVVLDIKGRYAGTAGYF